MPVLTLLLEHLGGLQSEQTALRLGAGDLLSCRRIRPRPHRCRWHGDCGHGRFGKWLSGRVCRGATFAVCRCPGMSADLGREAPLISGTGRSCPACAIADVHAETPRHPSPMYCHVHTGEPHTKTKWLRGVTHSDAGCIRHDHDVLGLCRGCGSTTEHVPRWRWRAISQRCRRRWCEHGGAGGDQYRRGGEVEHAVGRPGALPRDVGIG